MKPLPVRLIRVVNKGYISVLKFQFCQEDVGWIVRRGWSLHILAECPAHSCWVSCTFLLGMLDGKASLSPETEQFLKLVTIDA